MTDPKPAAEPTTDTEPEPAQEPATEPGTPTTPDPEPETTRADSATVKPGDEPHGPSPLTAQVEKLTAESRKWEKRAKANMAQLEEAKAQADAEAARATRYQVALATGLPPALADRLTGTTAEELTADAEALKGLLGNPNPGPPATTGSGATQSTEPTTTAAEALRVWGRGTP